MSQENEALTQEAQRLRNLVESAYYEGWERGYDRPTGGAYSGWLKSEAKKSLDEQEKRNCSPPVLPCL